MTNLDGKVAIVTGGARGIGRAHCLGLARDGASVVVADLKPADEVVAEIEGFGGHASYVQVDVTDRRSTTAMAEAALSQFGRIDVLVNNAGYMTTAVQVPFDQLDDEEWETPFAVNVKGSWLCACAVVPTMKQQRSGKIVNTSSMTVVDGTVDHLHYLTSKAAVIGMSRGMARELGEYGICVNTVMPDYIPHDPFYDARQAPGAGASIIARRCIQREEVPDDMVGIVVFLAGSGADFITGQLVAVNGGSAFL